MSPKQATGQAPEVVARLVKALIVANKAVGLYPATSEIPQQAAAVVVNTVGEGQRDGVEMAIGVRKDGIVHAGIKVLPARTSIVDFAQILYNRRISELRFHAGVTGDEILGLLTVIRDSPAVLEDQGGVASRLWEEGIAGISVIEVKVTVVDADALVSAQGHSEPLSRQEIDRAIGLDGSVGRRNNIVMARFFGDPDAVATYLTGLWGETASVHEVAARFALLASLSHSDLGLAIAAPRTLAEALTQLDVELSSAILVDEIIPEAKGDPALAGVLRQLDPETLFELVAQGVDKQNPPVELLARAVRVGSALYAGNPGDLHSDAASAMRRAGISPEIIEQALAISRPIRFEQAENRGDAENGGRSEEEESAIATQHKFQSITQGDVEATPGLAELRREAAIGVKADHIALLLADLVGAGLTTERFGGVVAALEAALASVTGTRSVAVVSEVTHALNEALTGDLLDHEQKNRLRSTLKAISGSTTVKAAVSALRDQGDSAVDRDAASNLLRDLGADAIGPLMDLLASEKDMAVRKAMLDALSSMAGSHVSAIGRYVSDDRWFVVRNVVVILAAVKSAEAIPYFERTLRHPDARVRRETIRALAPLNDSRAQHMIISALQDEDPRNIQLAARSLGTGKVTIAVPALERVARGNGPGGGDLLPRLDAIEALGRIGSSESLTLLGALAGRRISLIPGRSKEIRAAAETAMNRIQAGSST